MVRIRATADPQYAPVRLFASVSLWNTYKTGYSFDSDADSALSNATWALNNSDYSHPYYEAASGDSSCQFDLGAGWGWPAVTITAKAPDMTPAAGSDGVCSVLLTQGGTASPSINHFGYTTTIPANTLLDMFGVTKVSATHYDATYYGLCNGVEDDGYNGFGDQDVMQGVGTMAIGCPQAAGTILARDITAGAIPHALCVCIPDNSTYAGGANTSGTQMVPPAIYEDLTSTTGPLPQGGLLLIPPTTSKPGGLSAGGSMLWDACQMYGAYFADKASGCYFYGDRSTTVGNAISGTDCTTVGRALRLAITW